VPMFIRKIRSAFSPRWTIQASKIRSVFDYRFLKKDGTYCWLRGERMLMRDADGNPMEFVGSWSDITERKKTEETLRLSEARYRSLYEGMMDSYVSVEMDGRILHFNQAYQKMVGYEPDELRQLTYHDLTPEKWHAFEAEITEKQVIGRGYSDIYEKEYIRKDGTSSRWNCGPPSSGTKPAIQPGCGR
jgi:PAS domain S-box-containing protein